MDKLEAAAGRLGIRLSQKQIEQFQTYYRELIDWNERINLTAITDYQEVQNKHFLDSLTVVLGLGNSFNSPRVIDVGAGAGFPGLPLKIALPGIRLAVLEATAKKTSFLNHLQDKLGLDGVEVVTGRAEEVAHQTQYRESFDVVLSRAMAELPVLAELCLPFVRIGGLFIAQKKGVIDAEVKNAGRAIALMGGRLREVRKIEMEELSDGRYLVIIDKIALTPPQYPRRPGMPNKRPIT
ncbi:MAG: 16S rRNA (guanine(527)-N(7))-methyltransferase RsmG [Dehalococcoidales bacterium]|nr:16S rRNA (guanine(527)-N(7))-methyltransferase RsmG [Dehalococcoidales bacterium]